MRKLLTTSLLVAIALCACGKKPNPTAASSPDTSTAQIAGAKQAVEAQLSDPMSAQYRNVAAYSEGIVCGEVNAKNKMGGYVGFEPFIYPTFEGRVDMGKALSAGDVEIMCNNKDQKIAALLTNRKQDLLAYAESRCRAPAAEVLRESDCKWAQDIRDDLATIKQP